MKIKGILGLLAAVGGGVIATTMLSPKEENLTSYIPRDNQVKEQGAQGMIEYLNSVRKNVNTGKIEAQDYINAVKSVKQFVANQSSRAVNLSFVPEGPDNFGGRTRAIQVDINDNNTIYAGSVSGGLYKSTNRGNTWQRVEAFSDNLAVSSIAQTKSGTIYVATGSSFELSSIANGASGGHRADGVWYTDDEGASFSKLTPTPLWTVGINQLIADPIANDKLWVAGEGSIRLTTVENKTNFNNISGIVASCDDIKASPDGQMFLALAGNRTYVSTDAGSTFSRVSGTGSGQIKEIGGITRMEGAIGFDKNELGNYTLFVVQVKSGSLGKLNGIWLSKDNGVNWTEVVPGTPNTLDAAAAFATDPFSGSTQWQGNYDCIISGIPSQPNNFIVGGVRLFRYDGNFGVVASNQADPTSPLYVHSDIHEFHWDNTGRLYIGSDGGVSVSDNMQTLSSPSYYVSNRGYNTMQLYGIGYSKFGDLIGGSQDNGTKYKDVSNLGTTPLEFTTAFGGDGFDCDISYLNSDVALVTSQTGVIARVLANGAGGGIITSDDMLGIPAQFHTTIRMFENENDTNSTDSVWFVATESKNAGETIMVPSKNMDILFPHVLTQPLNVTLDSIFINNDTVIDGVNYNTGDTAYKYLSRDTIRIQDVVQTITASGFTGAGGLWVTRGVLRFGTTPVWWKVLNSVGEVRSIEWSKDGDILYVGETSGRLTRIKGFNGVYYNNEANDTINGINDADSAGYKYADVRSGTQQLQVDVIKNPSSGQTLTGIAVDPNDPEHVVITLGGYGASTNIMKSTTAASTTGTSSFTSIKGNLPTLPCYDAIIDYQNPNIIVVATEMGIYGSDNGGGSWTSQNTELGIVPVFALRQQWRGWDKVDNQGVIYAGTHGRGIWSSSSLLSVEENDLTEKSALKLVNVYPNPADQLTNLSFEINETKDVTLSIFSIQGRLIETKTINSAQAGLVKTTLNVENYTKGTYFVNIQSEGSKFKVAKFIKN